MMKSFLFFSVLALSLSVCSSGCGRPDEVIAIDPNMDAAAEQQQYDDYDKQQQAAATEYK